MPDVERFEVLVLGSGKSGKHLAWHMASAGRRTAVVERKWIGGSCPNVNCLPSKNEVRSAEVAELVRRAPAFGTSAPGARTDMAKVLQRKRRMVDEEIAFHLEKYRETGVDLVLGDARFVRSKTVEVRLNDGGARVGLNEVEARQRGVPLRIATLPLEEVLRTHTTDETRGFMKALVHEQRDDILGFAMFGADAGEVMAVVQMAMMARMPFTAVRDAVLTHPTMAEGLGELFGRVLGQTNHE